MSTLELILVLLAVISCVNIAAYSWRRVRLDQQEKMHEQVMKGPRPFFMKDGATQWNVLENEPDAPQPEGDEE